MTSKSKKTTADKGKESPHPLMIDQRGFDRLKTMLFICQELATSSRGLGNILKAGINGMKLPEYSTIMQWMIDDKALSDMYARAKEDQGDFMADEMLDIADATAEDNVAVQRNRLRVDTRKWLAAKLKPKKYGEKIDVNQTIMTKDLTDEDLSKRLTALLGHK